MKKVLLVLLLLASSLAVPQSVVIGGRHRKIWASAPAASVVQAISCRAGSGTGTCTTTAITVTSGHALAFCAGSNGAGTLSSLLISTGTNTLASFTQLFTPLTSPNGFDCRYLMSTNATGSTTFKPTFSVTNAMQFVVYELIVPTGLDGTVPAPLSNASSATFTCPSYTTVHANALVICGALTTTSESLISPSAGFTIPTGGSNLAASGGATGAMEYQANVGSGTVLNPTMTAGAAGANSASTFAFN